MMCEQMKCPKCAGKMVQGFVPDYSDASIFVSSWHEGKPRKSFWTVAKAPRIDGVSIGAFRCEKCGYLEFYADAKFAAQ
jgi:hypothetical protein